MTPIPAATGLSSLVEHPQRDQRLPGQATPEREDSSIGNVPLSKGYQHRPAA